MGVGLGIDRHGFRIEYQGRSIWPQDGCGREVDTVAAQDERHVAAEQPRRGEHDGVEDRLHVSRRSADDAQDVGGRGLAGQRLLRFVEQSRVLDGDHGLSRKALKQCNLLVGKRLHLLPGGDNTAENSAILDKRYRQKTANTAEVNGGAQRRLIRRLR